MLLVHSPRILCELAWTPMELQFSPAEPFTKVTWFQPRWFRARTWFACAMAELNMSRRISRFWDRENMCGSMLRRGKFLRGVSFLLGSRVFFWRVEFWISWASLSVFELLLSSFEFLNFFWALLSSFELFWVFWASFGLFWVFWAFLSVFELFLSFFWASLSNLSFFLSSFESFEFL